MILFAVNINSGGGKILLDELLFHSTLGTFKILFLDIRYKVPSTLDLSTFEIHYCNPSFLDRLKAEIMATQISRQQKLNILFFGNIPPILKQNNNSTLYLQNAFLLPTISLFKVKKLKLLLRHFYERTIFKLFYKNVNSIWVQTLWMQQELQKWNKQLKVEIKPFLPTFPALKSIKPKPEFDLILVTGLQPHKRFREFLEALKLSHRSDLKVLMVLDKDSYLKVSLQQILLPENTQIVTCDNREALFDFYQKSKNLLITSEFESFCLPIYEARYCGLNIIVPSEPFTEEIKSFTHQYEFKKLKNFLADFN